MLQHSCSTSNLLNLQPFNWTLNEQIKIDKEIKGKKNKMTGFRMYPAKSGIERLYIQCIEVDRNFIQLGTY